MITGVVRWQYRTAPCMSVETQIFSEKLCFKETLPCCSGDGFVFVLYFRRGALLKHGNNIIVEIPF